MKQLEPELLGIKALIVGMAQEVHNSLVDLCDNSNISGIQRNWNVRQKNVLKEAWNCY